MIDVILKRFEEPDEVREMVKGRFEIVHIGGVTIGRATYEPGWRWSEHEVSYEAGKAGATPSKVRAAVKKVGNSRAKVEAELKRGR